jgi:hypothetical protein
MVKRRRQQYSKGIIHMATKPKAHHYPGSGNVELILGGEKLVLRPTLNAGMAISRQAGGIRGAIDKVMAMDLDAIVGVVRLGIGPEEAKRVKNLDRLIYENGLMDAQGEVLGKCMEYLSNLARGGRPADAMEVTEDDIVDPPNPET